MPAQSSSVHQVLVTPDDHGPIIIVAALFCLVVAILAVVARLTTRLLIRRVLALDDVLIIVSTTLHVGQTIAICLGARTGLGTHQWLLDPGQLDAVDKSIYAGDLLFVLTVVTAKVSALELLRGLAAISRHRTIALATSIAATAWAAIVMFPLLFRCKVPRVWDLQSHCMNTKAYWISFLVIDVSIDLVMMILPVFMLAMLPVSLSKKLSILFAFSCRIFVIAATAIRLNYIIKAFHAADYSFSAVNVQVASQCVLVLSALAACIPSLKPLLDAFASGMLHASVPGAQTETYMLSSTSDKPHFSTRYLAPTTLSQSNDEYLGLAVSTRRYPAPPFQYATSPSPAFRAADDDMVLACYTVHQTPPLPPS